MHIVSYAVFIYYYNCISFSIHLSGRKVAIKLTNWLSLKSGGCVSRTISGSWFWQY